MNSTYLVAGAAVCFSVASLMGLTGSGQPSPYVAGGIVLLSFACATRFM